ncbi:carbohydrate ABC transporter permease [Candidatus Hadarchaeum sp.]|uniref:carbohydrate ABC transporter permease n=1 Tax=Candidatus Hadarchaeum sp. TaxID=2883567 RepID=UPI003857C7E7
MYTRSAPKQPLGDIFLSKKGSTTFRLFAQICLLILPALLMQIVFHYIPLGYMLRLSFFDWDLISPVQSFAGLSNYSKLLTSSEFRNSLVRTVQYTLIYVSGTMVLSLGLAVTLNRLRRARGFFETLFFIPSVTSVAVIAVIWSYLYNPYIGPINRCLLSIGVPGPYLPKWLNSPSTALLSLAVIDIWRSLGLMTLLFLAGLRNIPVDLYEAAEIDGATASRIFWNITLPLLSPVLVFVFFTLFINSFKVFDLVAILTQGRPLGATEVVLYLIYRYSFRFFDAGLASAASCVVFLLLLLLSGLQLTVSRRWVYYAGSKEGV